MSVDRRGRRFVSGAVAVVLLVALVATWSAVAPARAASVVVDTSSSLAVTTAAPYKFVQDAYENLPTNTTINVTVTDADTLPHTFSILDRAGWVIPASADLATLFSTYGHLVSVNVTGSGGQARTSFTSPGPGWYEFVCLEPGHFQEGMYGYIAFGMALPTNLTPASVNTGPGIAVFIISGTIVALVLIAIVLGFVVGQRRGSTHEMPPERLGYPEPLAPPPPPSTGPPLP